MDHQIGGISHLDTKELIKIALFVIVVGTIANLLAILIAQKLS
jgi:hypothetical protein